MPLFEDYLIKLGSSEAPGEGTQDQRHIQRRLLDTLAGMPLSVQSQSPCRTALTSISTSQPALARPLTSTTDRTGRSG